MNSVCEIWIDAHLSPALAPWIEAKFGFRARSVKWLGLREATDAVIFQAAREADAVLITKDADFCRLLARYGPPPHVIWLTFGNTSNAHLRQVLQRRLPTAVSHIEGGEALVEIVGAQ